MAHASDIARRSLAALRSGLAPGGTSGPNIDVTPFGPTNASAPAGLIKLGTSIAAASRAKANFGLQLQARQLALQEQAAKVAMMRSHANYFEGRAHTGGGQPRVTTRQIGDYPPGTDLNTIHADIAYRGQQRLDSAQKDREARAGKLSAAKAGIAQLDAGEKAHVAQFTNQYEQNVINGLLTQIKTGGPQAADAASALGVDPNRTNKALQGDDPTYLGVVQWAINNHKQKFAERSLSDIQQHNAPQRQQYNDVINRLSGTDAEPGAVPAQPAAVAAPAADSGVPDLSDADVEQLVNSGEALAAPAPAGP